MPYATVSLVTGCGVMRRAKPQSKLAVAAVVFAVLLPPLGLVLGVIAWFHIKIGGDELEGEQLSLVAMVLSLVIALVVALVVALVFGLGFGALVVLLAMVFQGGPAH